MSILCYKFWNGSTSNNPLPPHLNMEIICKWGFNAATGKHGTPEDCRIPLVLHSPGLRLSNPALKDQRPSLIFYSPSKWKQGRILNKIGGSSRLTGLSQMQSCTLMGFLVLKFKSEHSLPRPEECDKLKAIWLDKTPPCACDAWPPILLSKLDSPSEDARTQSD